MIDPKIFRKAAVMVSKGNDACCPSVRFKAGEAFMDSPHEDLFAKFFKPEIEDENEWGRWFGDLIESNALQRSIALLLCEQIAKDEIK